MLVVEFITSMIVSALKVTSNGNRKLVDSAACWQCLRHKLITWKLVFILWIMNLSFQDRSQKFMVSSNEKFILKNKFNSFKQQQIIVFLIMVNFSRSKFGSTTKNCCFLIISSVSLLGEFFCFHIQTIRPFKRSKKKSKGAANCYN